MWVELFRKKSVENKTDFRMMSKIGLAIFEGIEKRGGRICRDSNFDSTTECSVIARIYLKE